MYNICTCVCGGTFHVRGVSSSATWSLYQHRVGRKKSTEGNYPPAHLLLYSLASLPVFHLQDTECWVCIRRREWGSQATTDKENKQERKTGLSQTVHFQLIRDSEAKRESTVTEKLVEEIPGSCPKWVKVTRVCHSNLRSSMTQDAQNAASELFYCWEINVTLTLCWSLSHCPSLTHIHNSFWILKAFSYQM